MSELIYDWNTRRRSSLLGQTPIILVDETLRDGVQSPTVNDPELDQKMALVRLMRRTSAIFWSSSGSFTVGLWTPSRKVSSTKMIGV